MGHSRFQVRKNIFWHSMCMEISFIQVQTSCDCLQTKLQMPLVEEANLIARKLHLDKHRNPMLYAGKKLEEVNSNLYNSSTQDLTHNIVMQ